MQNQKITRKIKGIDQEVLLDDIWDSLVRIIRLARNLTAPNGDEYKAARLAFLTERLEDLEGLEFHRSPKCLN